MTEVASTPPSIDTDTLCTRCGYNLRGLAHDGQCPECGAEIQSSIRGDLLRFADPAWLDQLRLGVSLKLWNIGLTILVMFASGLIVAMLGFPLALINLMGLASGALGVWASFAVTAQEPRISLNEDPLTLRRIIRWGAALVFLGNVFSLVEYVDLGALKVVVKVCGALLGLLAFVLVFAELVYLRRFAFRIPDEALAKSTRSLIWVFGILAPLAVIIGVLTVMLGKVATAGTPPAPAPGAGPSGALIALFAGFGCFFGVASLVASLWYVRLLTKFKKAFQQAAAQARASSLEH